MTIHQCDHCKTVIPKPSPVHIGGHPKTNQNKLPLKAILFVTRTSSESSDGKDIMKESASSSTAHQPLDYCRGCAYHLFKHGELPPLQAEPDIRTGHDL